MVRLEQSPIGQVRRTNGALSSYAAPSRLASATSFGRSKGSDPTALPIHPVCGGRHHFGTVGDIISERWATSSRNGGRHHLGTVGGFAPTPQSYAVVAIEAHGPARRDAGCGSGAAQQNQFLRRTPR